MSDHLARFLSELSVDLASAAALPQAFLEEAVRDFAGSNAERASIHMSLAAARAEQQDPSDARALRDFFSAQEAREEQPWRREARKAEMHLDAFAAQFFGEGPFEPLRVEFGARARAGLFSEEEALLLHYLLVPPAAAERSRFDLASLFLCVPVGGRLAVHNWRAARSWHPSRREGHGTAIARLARPLFPDAPGFEALNAALLAEALAVEGGGPARPSSVFSRAPSRGLAPPAARAPRGGGALPIYGPDGVQGLALETGPLEAEFAALRAEIAALRRPPVWRGRGGYRGAGARGGQQSQHHQSQNHQHQSQNHQHQGPAQQTQFYQQQKN